jgi:nucleoside phosphorylase
MCGVGAMGRDSVIIATQEAVGHFKPKGIVMVGIAFGRDASKQALGDVLVASQVISYEQQRIGGQNVVQRGFIVETGPTLLNRFKQALDWTFTDEQGHQMQMHIGPILSGEKLVDRASYKEQLFRVFPQAIGGEMEGAGLYAVAARSGLEWIVVKGICDWADGTKTDDAQPLAAVAAASLVDHVLSDPTVLEALS